VVSTDDPEVKDLAEKHGVEVPYFPRKKELCEDVDTTLVILDIVKFLEEKEGYKPTHVVTLQPTSPFRLPSDIDKCVDLALASKAETVISVTKVSQHPYWMFRGEKTNSGLILEPYEKIDLTGDVLVSQSLPQNIFYPNGAVYVTRVEIINEGRIFGRKILGYEMPRIRSIDIEDPLDFIVAENLLKVVHENDESWSF